MERETKELLTQLIHEIRDLGFGNASNKEGIGAVEGLTMKLCDKFDDVSNRLEDINETLKGIKAWMITEKE